MTSDACEWVVANQIQNVAFWLFLWRVIKWTWERLVKSGFIII